LKISKVNAEILQKNMNSLKTTLIKFIETEKSKMENQKITWLIEINTNIYNNQIKMLII